MKKRILSCLMALALCLTLLPTAVLAVDTHAEQQHCLCGTSGCNGTVHGTASTMTIFNQWLGSSQTSGKLQLLVGGPNNTYGTSQDTQSNKFVLTEGNYYLKTSTEESSLDGDVKIKYPIQINGNVTICLNGKTIESSAKDQPVFEVTSGSTLTLTDCKGNAGKVKHTSDGSGSGVKVESGGTFNMYGGTITGNTTTQRGGGVCVTGTNSKFNMYGGTISGNNATNGGGGVYVSGGTFTMNGNASVTSNRATDQNNGIGGGVYVVDGTFTMNGGTITKNTASSTDGGVGVYTSTSTATFTMNGGTISGNTATKGGGVGVYSAATFNMSGTASITDNTANQGGGVYVKVTGVDMNSGKFEMNGTSSVSGNTATQNGGGVYVESGTFTMNYSASVKGNTASGNTADQGNGGGVYVKSGTFEMNGSASVQGNTATNTGSTTNTTYGGGVGVYGGTFTMNDGTITGNTATNGGGVCVKSGGKFNMNGNASIKSNTGNGVFVNGGTFTVSGSPTITENTMNGDASNVFLAGGAYITIGRKLEGASIGVTKVADKGVIATNVTADYSNNFFSDARHKVEYDKTDEANHKLVLTNSSAPAEHTHIWTYEANGAIITATCKVEGCDVKNGGRVTIKAPAYTDLIYNGSRKPATVTVSGDWKGPAKNEITITYEQKNGDSTYTKMSDAPIKVGTYRASITVKGATATVKGATASVEYAILASAPGKKDQQPLILKSTEKTLAVGKTLILSVDGGSGDGEVVYEALGSNGGAARIDGNVLTADSAGVVTVTAVKKGDKDYAEARSESLTITITEKSGGTTPSQPGGSTGGNTGGSSSSGGSSSGGSGSYDSNPIIKTETKNNADGSTTKTETRKDGSVTQTTTAKDGSTSKTETKKDGSSVTENKAADGSTGTIKTDKNGKTEMNAKVSAKAVENAKKSGEPVKAPVEVEASRNSGAAPTVKVELPGNAGKTEVEIPVSNANAGTVAVLVHPDGTEEILKNSIPTEDGIQLTVDGSATVKIVDNSKDFIDTRNHWAREEIDFVSARELVNGMSDTIYAPNASATRAQLWTILARQNDADLNGGSVWYEKAQLWSKDKGISDGTEPNAAINRAQMVTMLWRTMGQPAATDKVSFADVPAGSYYAQAVSWAVENGITTGVGGGRFDPAATCTRAQIAAFLTRLYAEK